MYLLRAKEKVDKEVRRKERRARKRARRKRRERRKIDSYQHLLSSWSDATFNCDYLGSFEILTVDDVDDVNKVEVKEKLADFSKLIELAQPALLTICIEGIEVHNKLTDKMAMAHALSRIAYMTLHPEEPIVGFVAKNPKVRDRYCHVFKLRKRKRAQEVHKRVRKALKIFEMEYDLGKAAQKKGDKPKRRKSHVKHVNDDDEASAPNLDPIKSPRQLDRAGASVGAVHATPAQTSRVGRLFGRGRAPSKEKKAAPKSRHGHKQRSKRHHHYEDDEARERRRRRRREERRRRAKEEAQREGLAQNTTMSPVDYN
mmetsp:Transcript_1878/g.5966  ORF Transcript_1878/g.5966 Transcript_1878/m.5966 type:complete len:314 (-) Transcript_1878:140-1081(-)